MVTCTSIVSTRLVGVPYMPQFWSRPATEATGLTKACRPRPIGESGMFQMTPISTNAAMKTLITILPARDSSNRCCGVGESVTLEPSGSTVAKPGAAFCQSPSRCQTCVDAATV